MQPVEKKSKRLEQFEELAGINLGRPIEPREYLFLLRLGFDPDAQFNAILSLLKEHDELSADTHNEIRRREERANTCERPNKEFVVDAFREMVEYSIYQDAAHSMAAVGMLAPLFETVFTQCFITIHRRYSKEQLWPGGHIRWQQAGLQAWDCHYVFVSGNPRKNLVKGVMQLSEATGLQEYLPSNYQEVLEALFAYRNKMFHFGLEWPIAEREKFAQRIIDAGWPNDWFEQASINKKPWVFCLSHEFIDVCQLTFQRVLDAFCELIKQLEGEATA